MSNETNIFWIETYERRLRQEIVWTYTFAGMVIFCLGCWVIYPIGWYLFIAALEYLCFVGHLDRAFGTQKALEAELERAYEQLRLRSDDTDLVIACLRGMS